MSHVFPALVHLILFIFLEQHVTGQLRPLFWWHLLGGFLACQSSEHVDKYSSLLSHHNKSCHGCFSGPGSTITAFNLLATWSCVLYRQGFSSSVCQAVARATQAFMTEVSSNARRNGPVGVFKGMYQTMHFLPLN